MKKLIAILLLAVHLFNLGGYSLAFRYFIQQQEEQFVQQLDKHAYQEAELVEISIPLHLPYMQNSSNFERINGSIENNGLQYNYVKRRLYNDTLHIMCLPNQEKTQLTKGKSGYAEQVNDFTGNKKEKESTAKKAAPGAEYSYTIPQYNITFTAAITTPPSNGFQQRLAGTFIDMPEHPPQAIC